MGRYKTLLLDADDTIFDFGAAERIAFFAVMKAAELPVNDGMYAVYSAINDCHWKALERGEITRAQVLRGRYAAYLEHFSLEGDPDRINGSYLEQLSHQAILFDDSMDAMRELAQDHRIYIVTNGNAMVQRGRFSQSPVMQYVDGYFISGEIGYEKPDIRYFHAVFDSIPDFDPTTTLLAGDSATGDLKGAINAGLDSCYVDRRGKPLPEGICPTYCVSDLSELVKLLRKDN
ncbi:MAG: YjjG family noncanonical pyrimidine nucleotidase [Clostridia bacterium]|nr:YjjG family noncanonical pyrimidine nucleotidase [Clostridia bacterium]